MIYPDKVGSRLRRGALRVTVTLLAAAGIIVAGSATKVEFAPAPVGTSTVR